MIPGRRGFGDRPAGAAGEPGSAESFESLVREHAPRIFRLAYHFLGNWDEAKDLAQETMARAFSRLDRYDPAQSFETWLCTIAARLSIDRLRQRRRFRAVKKELAAIAPRATDPDLTLSLREALEHLTPRQRQAVVLCDLHGFTALEAARMLGCSASTVRVQRFLARRRMRMIFATGGPTDEAELSGSTAAVTPLAPEARD